ncbi:MAG: hypothetical protein JWN31_325, partial [Frankiales bacterium]|nr:hypothetical protein [Frankiales bacterium]
MSPSRVTALAVAGLLVLAGCGSTAQQTAGGQSVLVPGSDGLSVDPATGLPPTTTGPAAEVASGSSTTGGQPTAPGALTPTGATVGTAPGHRTLATGRVTTPLSLGILAIGSANGAASAIGANYSTTTTGADVAAALVRYYNKHGGIAGRTIKPVQYTMQATAANNETEAESACAKFTQDNKVSAVVSVLANGYYANYEQCLTTARVPDYVGLTGTADDR